MSITIPCACGKKSLLRGLIRQERLAANHWRVHDFYECYETNRGAKKTLARKSATAKENQ